MTKQELAYRIALRTGMSTQQALEAIQATTDIIMRAVRDHEKVTLRGFGSFSRRHCQVKMARDINANQALVVGEHDTPSFKPSRRFRKFIK